MKSMPMISTWLNVDMILPDQEASNDGDALAEATVQGPPSSEEGTRACRNSFLLFSFHNCSLNSSEFMLPFQQHVQRQ